MQTPVPWFSFLKEIITFRLMDYLETLARILPMEAQGLPSQVDVGIVVGRYDLNSVK